MPIFRSSANCFLVGYSLYGGLNMLIDNTYEYGVICETQKGNCAYTQRAADIVWK
jgi:hypothetical protein